MGVPNVAQKQPGCHHLEKFKKEWLKVPIIKKAAIVKKTVKRGTSESVNIRDQLVVGWKDNKAVHAMSTRFNRVDRMTELLPIPDLISNYNHRMGGVDLLDNLVACYRIPFR